MKNVIAPRINKYLIDNSAWARLAAGLVDREAVMASVFERGIVVVCTPQVLEMLYSARNTKEHFSLQRDFENFPLIIPDSDTHKLAMKIQEQLWVKGKIRAAGAFDILIAALALQNHTTVIHYDGDYEHIASVVPEFHHEWVVPRGSVS